MRIPLTVTADEACPVDYAGWLWRGAGAIAFVSIGLEKFGDDPRNQWITLFARLGLGSWFRPFTGGVEIAGGLLLLFPRTTRAGACVLAATMVGAMLAHLTRLGDPPAAIIPFVLLLAVLFVGFREPDLPISPARRRAKARQRARKE